jgi:molybdopterin/thiamine biosynthesis adenylyltransferase
MAPTLYCRSRRSEGGDLAWQVRNLEAQRAFLAWARTTPLTLNFSRIQHLLSPAVLEGKVVVQVGLGSGGAPVCDHLTMNGVRNWILYDPDTLQDVNLVKHPRNRRDLGRLKVDIQSEWIIDRNSEARVKTRPEDVFNSQGIHDDIPGSDLILCCTDTRATRLLLNDLAVRYKKPCITASVFRQGFGGEVYGYIPGYSGCFECMDRVASKMGLNINLAIEPTEKEKETIYGMNLPDFQASGLSLDINTTALIQARMALDVLIDGKPGYSGGNWIVHYNRAIPGVEASGRLKSSRPVLIRSQKDCACHD